MKQTLIIILTGIFSLLIYSCADQTYAKLLEAEQDLISEYLVRNNIEVLGSFPEKGTVWKSNQYVKLDDGIYFHLVSQGDVNDSVKYGDEVIMRFKSYTLNENPDSVINWSTIEYLSPPQFVYDGSTTYACTAWITAIYYMKYQYSEAKIIAPSKTGFNSTNVVSDWGLFDDDQSVTPRLYHLSLKFTR